MAIRYAIGRKTIACSSLPREIAVHYVPLMNDSQKAMILRDIRDELEMQRSFKRDEMWEQIDAPNWEALADALDPNKHVQVKVNYEGAESVFTCFKHDGKWVEVDNYFKTGRRTQYVNPDYIIE